MNALKTSLIFYAATGQPVKSRKRKPLRQRTTSKGRKQKSLQYNKKLGKKPSRRTRAPKQFQLAPLQTTHERPLGIFILVILIAIGGSICLLLAICLFSLFSLLIGTSFLRYIGVSGTIVIFAFQFFIFVFGVFLFWLAYRLWYLDPGAHTIAILLFALGFLLALMSHNLPGMIVDGVIIFYLMLPGVKSAFGKTSLFI